MPFLNETAFSSQFNVNFMNAYNDYRARRFFGSLDGIRCICIVAVIWHHTVKAVPWLPITSRGFLGVDMFFVLSGFLIVTLLLREREKTGDISLPKFYMRRTLRIFPLYYTILAVLAILFLFVIPNSDLAKEFRPNLPYYLTYTSNWIHDTSILAVAWSLATEEQFYLVWPPIEKYLKRWGLVLLGAFIVVNQLINFGVLFPEAHAQLDILQSTFTPISLGVLLAHLLHTRKGFEQLVSMLSHRMTPLIVGLVLLLVINLPPFGSDISGAPRLIIQLLMTLLLASVVVQEDHILAKPFQNNLIVRMGMVSYGMYLYHMLVRHVAGAVVARLPIDVPLALFISTLIGTIIVSELSFRFYETPFLKFKKRWETIQTRPKTGSAA